MTFYILGNGNYAREIFEQFFLKENKYNFGGFITLISDKAFVINTDGIHLFNYSTDSYFIIGCDLLIDPIITYFTNKYSSLHFPNMFSNTSYISISSMFGYGNIFSPFSSIIGVVSIGNFNRFHIHSGIRDSTIIGNYNILDPYANISINCTIGDNNIFKSNSNISEKIIIENNNLISAGECLFDNMESDRLFQSGIIMKKKK